MLLLCAVYVLGFQEHEWVNKIVEDKVSHFMGEKFSVDIGSVRGGVFKNMVLEDVAFKLADNNRELFGVERMEISYRLWWVFLEKLGRLDEGEGSLNRVSLFFGKENPFVRGYLELYAYPGKIEVFGYLAPVIFGEVEKRGLKGVCVEREGGAYDCSMLWDRRNKILGTLSTSDKKIEIEAKPIYGDKWTLKVKGRIEEGKTVSIYSRLDQVDLFGSEMIGDIWVNFDRSDRAYFDVRAENLMVNKVALWDAELKGSFLKEKKLLVLENLAWGGGISIKGTVGASGEYPVDLVLDVKDVELHELVRNFGAKNDLPTGLLEAHLEAKGPVRQAEIKGRIYIDSGHIGLLEFISAFATIEGKLPVISLVDGKVIKEDGKIDVAGELDCNEAMKDSFFGKVMVSSGSKTTVWQEWSDSPPEGMKKQEASRGEDSFNKFFESDDFGSADPFYKTLDRHKDSDEVFEFEAGNSVKLGLEETDRSAGMEHKVRF